MNIIITSIVMAVWIAIVGWATNRAEDVQS